VQQPIAMADPFEVRMRFTGHLQHLNASVNSAQKATQFALKHKDLHEDLHSCIIEQLELVCFILCKDIQTIPLIPVQPFNFLANTISKE
jgi:hypothetical protein